MNGPSTRRARTGLWRLLAAIAAMALLAAACGDDDNGTDVGTDTTEDGAPAEGRLAELRAEGVTIGIANEVPFGFVGDDGEATGIAPEVAREVLAELGIDEVDAVVVEFGNLIGGLQAGQFDLIAAGMYINPDRAQQIRFSDPDYCIAESLAVAEGNPFDIVDYQSVVDNPEIIMAVATGTVEVEYAEDAGVPDNQLREFADIDGMYDALAAGEVDAVTGTSATVQRQVASRSGMEAVEPFFPTTADGEEVLPCGAYGFSNDDEEFRNAFNDVLNEMRESGRTIEIITAYEDFSEADVERANALTLEDFLD
ncbi:MAG: ectoine/hydroxyectoine ABC transporter substrate-binding protein EhuB [Acidimicrobiales bacterium]